MIFSEMGAKSSVTAAGCGHLRPSYLHMHKHPRIADSLSLADVSALSLLPIRLWECHTGEIHLSPSSPPCQPDTYSSCSHDLNRLMHALAPLPASLLRTSTCYYLSTWFQFPSQVQPICVIAILLSSLKCTEVG